MADGDERIFEKSLGDFRNSSDIAKELFCKRVDNHSFSSLKSASP
jgi:hypothetical protein